MKRLRLVLYGSLISVMAILTLIIVVSIFDTLGFLSSVKYSRYYILYFVIVPFAFLYNKSIANSILTLYSNRDVKLSVSSIDKQKYLDLLIKASESAEQACAELPPEKFRESKLMALQVRASCMTFFSTVLLALPFPFLVIGFINASYRAGLSIMILCFSLGFGYLFYIFNKSEFKTVADKCTFLGTISAVPIGLFQAMWESIVHVTTST